MDKKRIDIGFIFIGLIGMVILSALAIIDSQATDIVSGVIVQLFFVALFIGGYISYSLKDKQNK